MRSELRCSDTKKIYFLATMTILTVFFPLLGLFVNIAYYIFFQLYSKEKAIVFINITISMAFIAYLYVRLDATGDVYRYELSLQAYAQSILNGRTHIVDNIYESFYPLWYFILYSVSKLKLTIGSINFLAGLAIYGSFLYIVYQLDSKYPSLSFDKQLFIKIFLLMSFVAIFASYKTMWAFSFVSLGLYMLMNDRKKGFIFLLLGAGLHPIAYFPIFIYFLSRLIEFRIIYLYISLIIALTMKLFISVFVHFDLPFIGEKINTYIYGEWAQYRFQENGEYMIVLLLALLVGFVFTIFAFWMSDLKAHGDKYFCRYNNFIFWYFSVALWFLTFRTIESRLILDGAIFFFPLFYQVLQHKILYRRRLISVFLLFGWFLAIDLRTFNIFNSAYRIGDGFPYNLFESPIFLILKGTL